MVDRAMDDDVRRIREVVEDWAAAVHAGDLDGVLRDHTRDIVMFDVPPPDDGVRGIEAYRETWPPFFDWQARGASFEIVSLAGTGMSRQAAHMQSWPSGISAICSSPSRSTTWTGVELRNGARGEIAK